MSLNRQERSTAISLALVFASRMLGLFMVLPVFAIYARDYAGSTPALIGVAIGAYGLTQALLQIPFGLWSDRIGRKPLIYIGLLLFAVGSALAASAHSIYAVIAGRALQGAGAISSVVMALLSDLTRPQRRTTAMAIIGGTIALSFTLSLVLGPLLAPHIGLSGLFWLTAALAVIGALLVRFAVADAPPRLAADSVPNRRELAAMLRDPQLRRLDGSVMILHLVMTATFVALPGWLHDGGFAKGDLSYLYLGTLVVSFLLLWPLLRRSRTRGTRQTLRLAQLLLVLALMLLAILPAGLAAAVTAIVVFFVAFNYLEASLPALLARLAPAGSRGSAMGIYATSQFAGAFVGGAGGGVLYQQLGSHALFTALAVVVLGWWLWMAKLADVDGIKVINLALGPTLADGEGLRTALLALPGVVEARPESAAATVYLKVQVDEFDSAAAHAVIDRYSRVSN